MMRSPVLSVVACLLAGGSVAWAQSVAPTISAGGVVNAADYTPAVAPGMLIAVFGDSMASKVGGATSTPLPTVLDGTSVEVNGQAIPLFFVSPKQINAQMPFGISGQVQVRVRTPAGLSAPATATLVASAPRLLTKTMDGKGEALLTDGIDYKLVTSAVPARGNEYLTLYLTGLGAVGGTPVAGQPAGDGAALGPLSPATATVSATIGGKAARITWAGLAPGWAGLYQVNMQVAPDTPVGQQAVVVSAGSASSQANVTLSVSDAATALGEALITPAGGTVSAGGAQIKIPAGTVSANTTVRISRVDGPPTATNQASNVYVIRGLPSSLTGAIQITLPTTSAIDPASALVVTHQLWGAGDFARPDTPSASLAEPRHSTTLPASASASVSGVTVTLLPAPQAPPDQIDTEMEAFVLQYFTSLTCPGGNFMLFYPDVDPFNTHTDRICTWLDEAKQKIESQLGLVFGPGRKRWPMRAMYGSFVTAALADRWGEHVPGANGDINYDSIRLNLDPVKKAIANGASWESEMRATVGHELLHFVQNAYDARDPVTVARTPHRDLWYEEAMSTWFEGVMLGQADYISYVPRSFAWTFGFQHGLENPAPVSCTWAYLRQASAFFWGVNECSDVADAGYGASLLLRTVAKWYGAASLGDVMRQILSSPKTAAQALQTLTGNLGSVWTGFARSLVETNYNSPESWPQQSALLQIPKTGGADLIPSATDAVRKNFSDTWSAQDISLRLSRLSFTESLPQGSSLAMQFAAPNTSVTAYLYRYENKGVTFVDSFTDKYSLYDVDQFVSAKAVFLVLVVQSRCLNDCTGVIPVSLNFKTTTLAEWVLASTKASITFYGPLNFVDKKTGLPCGGGSVFGTIDMATPYGPAITWNGTTFTIAATGPGWPNASRTVSAAATVVLDKTATNINSMSFQETSPDGMAFSLSMTGIQIVMPVGGYTEKYGGFTYKLPGPGGALGSTSFVQGACIGTWLPILPSEGVEVILYRSTPWRTL